MPEFHERARNGEVWPTCPALCRLLRLSLRRVSCRAALLRPSFWVSTWGEGGEEEEEEEQEEEEEETWGVRKSALSLSLLGAISPSLQSVERSAAICQDMKGANLQLKSREKFY